jgi:hypothetical protein
MERKKVSLLKIKKPLITIGTIDMIDFPELQFSDIPCKIDTGADSSTIHCQRVRLKEIDGVEVLSVRFLSEGMPQYKKRDFQFKEFMEKRIRNSFGDSEFRYLVKLKVLIFSNEYEGWFTLSDRTKMKFPVLLGKKFLYKRFTVDVSLKNLSYKKKIQTTNK